MRGNGGATLIELTVAVAVSLMVIGTIFYAWNQLSRHIIVKRRAALFEAEARMIIGTIASQVRRSSQILAWHDRGITYLSPLTDDTITYDYYGEELLRNDTAVVPIAQNARITGFTVEADDLDDERACFNALLHIRLTMEDDFGNTADYRMDVAVRRPMKEAEEGGWNF